MHTFRLVNDQGTSTFVKFHWRPKLGLQSTCWDEAVKIAGADNDYHRRDLREAMAPGIDFSDDPLLQGRTFSYLDTQLSRLGSANWQQLPINQPKGAGLGLAVLQPASAATVAPQDLALSPALRLIDKYPGTLQGRTVGLLVSDGAEGRTVASLRKACEAAGAAVES